MGVCLVWRGRSTGTYKRSTDRQKRLREYLKHSNNNFVRKASGERCKGKLFYFFSSKGQMYNCVETDTPVSNILDRLNFYLEFIIHIFYPRERRDDLLADLVVVCFQ